MQLELSTTGVLIGGAIAMMVAVAAVPLVTDDPAGLGPGASVQPVRTKEFAPQPLGSDFVVSSWFSGEGRGWSLVEVTTARRAELDGTDWAIEHLRKVRAALAEHPVSSGQWRVGDVAEVLGATRDERLLSTDELYEGESRRDLILRWTDSADLYHVVHCVDETEDPETWVQDAFDVSVSFQFRFPPVF